MSHVCSRQAPSSPCILDNPGRKHGYLGEDGTSDRLAEEIKSQQLQGYLVTQMGGEAETDGTGATG